MIQVYNETEKYVSHLTMIQQWQKHLLYMADFLNTVVELYLNFHTAAWICMMY